MNNKFCLVSMAIDSLLFLRNSTANFSDFSKTLNFDLKPEKKITIQDRKKRLQHIISTQKQKITNKNNEIIVNKMIDSIKDLDGKIIDFLQINDTKKNNLKVINSKFYDKAKKEIFKKISPAGKERKNVKNDSLITDEKNCKIEIENKTITSPTKKFDVKKSSRLTRSSAKRQQEEQKSANTNFNSANQDDFLRNLNLKKNSSRDFLTEKPATNLKENDAASGEFLEKKLIATIATKRKIIDNDNNKTHSSTIKKEKNDYLTGYLKLKPNEEKRIRSTGRYDIVYTVMQSKALIITNSLPYLLGRCEEVTVKVGDQCLIKNVDDTKQLVVHFRKLLH